MSSMPVLVVDQLCISERLDLRLRMIGSLETHAFAKARVSSNPNPSSPMNAKDGYRPDSQGGQIVAIVPAAPPGLCSDDPRFEEDPSPCEGSSAKASSGTSGRGKHPPTSIRASRHSFKQGPLCSCGLGLKDDAPQTVAWRGADHSK